jgi:hypothetical protein
LHVKNAWSEVKTTLGVDIEKRASHIASSHFSYVTHSKEKGFLDAHRQIFGERFAIRWPAIHLTFV